MNNNKSNNIKVIPEDIYEFGQADKFQFVLI